MRRWLIPFLAVIAIAAIGVGTWQVIVTRSQLREARQQIVGLRSTNARQLAQAQARERTTESALASAQQQVSQLQYSATTTTTITATTTAPPPSNLTVTLTRENGQLTTGVSFMLTAAVWRTSDPNAILNGTVTFSSNGAALSFCSRMPFVLLNGGIGGAVCSLDFTKPGTYELSASSSITNGLTGSGTLTVTVSS